MRKYLMAIMTVMLFAGVGHAGGKTFKYVGVKGCKSCHSSKSRGNQYGIWLKTPHHNAYKVLATEKAKETAKKTGVTGDPQKSPKCLKCHTTAYGVDKKLIASTFKVEDGVQCEACHGPGSEYKKFSVMRKLYQGKLKPEDYGLVMPTEKTCKRCHNEECANYKTFNFEEFFKKIAHPIPKKG